jgi:transcriptional regulator with XRE-family HTH domain
MNFSQLQDRVRHVLLRRIERGTLSVSLLARQTGLGQPHISNFLRGRRGLSLASLDSILSAQKLEIADLLPQRRELSDPTASPSDGIHSSDPVLRIPLVSGTTAAFEPYIRASSVQDLIPMSTDRLKSLEPRCAASRKQWDRFVFVRATEEDARAMAPMLEEASLVLLDRHYTSLHPFTDARPNLYGVRSHSSLVLRYAQLDADRIVLRALRGEVKALILEPESGETPSDLLAGRVVFIQT